MSIIKLFMENTTKVKAVNVSSPERVISIIAGGFLLLDSLLNKKMRRAKALAGGYLMYRGVSGNCAMYRLAGRESILPTRNINLRTEMYIAKPRLEVYAMWRNLENLPLFMKHLQSVKEVYDNISEWKASIPGKLAPIGWRSVVVRDIPGEMISWRSLPDSMIENSGKIEFRDAENDFGTMVYTNISYRPPLGLMGNAIGEFFHPRLERIVLEDVYSFKQYAETGLTKEASL